MNATETTNETGSQTMSRNTKRGRCPEGSWDDAVMPSEFENMRYHQPPGTLGWVFGMEDEMTAETTKRGETKMRTYNLSRLLNDAPLRNLVVGYEDSDTAAERIALACDEQIPAEAIGYVNQLISESSSRPVQLDAARQLSRFVDFEYAIPTN